MTSTLSRRQVSILGASLMAPGGISMAGLVVPAYADELPDAADVLKRIQPVRVPLFPFQDVDGQILTLAEYHGHSLVVNLWATWCAPCRWELSTLSRLNTMLRPDHIKVLAIAVASGGAPAVESFFTRKRIEGLQVLADPLANSCGAVKTNAVPLTMIIDRDGKMVARRKGSADWGTSATASKVREWTRY